MTKTLTLKLLFKYSFNTFFTFMIYFFSLRLIENFNLYFSIDKFFAKFSTSNVNFSSFFIQKSTITSKTLIKISKNNFDNIAITCETIEIFKYL